MTASSGLQTNMSTGPTVWAFSNGSSYAPPDSPYIAGFSAYVPTDANLAAWIASATTAINALITWTAASGYTKTTADE